MCAFFVAKYSFELIHVFCLIQIVNELLKQAEEKSSSVTAHKNTAGTATKKDPEGRAPLSLAEIVNQYDHAVENTTLNDQGTANQNSLSLQKYTERLQTPHCSTGAVTEPQHESCHVQKTSEAQNATSTEYGSVNCSNAAHILILPQSSIQKAAGNLVNKPGSSQPRQHLNYKVVTPGNIANKPNSLQPTQHCVFLVEAPGNLLNKLVSSQKTVNQLAVKLPVSSVEKNTRGQQLGVQVSQRTVEVQAHVVSFLIV